MSIESFKTFLDDNLNPKEFGKALVHSAVEIPWNGVQQIAKAADVFLPACHIVSEVNNDTLAAQVGNLVGFAFDFALVHKFIVNPVVSRLGLAEGALGATTVRMGTTGALYGGLLTATDPGQNLLASRLKNATIEGTTFAAMGGTLEYLGGAGNFPANSFEDKLRLNAMSGGAGGIVNAEFGTVLNDHRQAALRELAEQGCNYAAIGSAFGIFSAGLEAFGKTASVDVKSVKSTSPEVSDMTGARLQRLTGHEGITSEISPGWNLQRPQSVIAQPRYGLAMIRTHEVPGYFDSSQIDIDSIMPSSARLPYGQRTPLFAAELAQDFKTQIQESVRASHRAVEYYVKKYGPLNYRTMRQYSKAIVSDLRAPVDILAERLNIPHVIVDVNATDGIVASTAAGEYIPGTNHLFVNAFVAGDPNNLPKVLCHEMVHAEQTNLISRLLADELHSPKEFTNADVQNLMAEWEKRKLLWPMDESYAREVLRLREGKPLDASERNRALELMRSFQDFSNQPSDHEIVEVVIRSALASLEDPSPSSRAVVDNLDPDATEKSEAALIQRLNEILETQRQNFISYRVSPHELEAYELEPAMSALKEEENNW